MSEVSQDWSHLLAEGHVEMKECEECLQSPVSTCTLNVLPARRKTVRYSLHHHNNSSDDNNKPIKEQEVWADIAIISSLSLLL